MLWTSILNNDVKFFFFKNTGCMYVHMTLRDQKRYEVLKAVGYCYLKIQKFWFTVEIRQLFYLKMAVVQAGMRLLKAFISMFVSFCFFVLLKQDCHLLFLVLCCGRLTLASCQLPTPLLTCCPSSIAQREKIKRKSSCVELKPGISLTNY